MTEQALSGHTIVVLGATGGLGRAVTERLQADGASVLAADRTIPAQFALSVLTVKGETRNSKLAGIVFEPDGSSTGGQINFDGNLPYGDQRRLEIARAMCTDPVLLCLDEPAAGLNPRETADLTRLLLAIRDEQRIGILLIEHDMRLVMGISDRIVVLNYGRKIADGAPETIRSDPAVIKAYLGEPDDLAMTA